MPGTPHVTVPRTFMRSFSVALRKVRVPQAPNRCSYLGLGEPCRSHECFPLPECKSMSILTLRLDRIMGGRSHARRRSCRDTTTAIIAGRGVIDALDPSALGDPGEEQGERENECDCPPHQVACESMSQDLMRG